MSRYAVIRGGAVFTVTETDDEGLVQREGWIHCDESIHVGDLWDGAAFTDTPDVRHVPTTVYMRQAQRVLLQVGLLDMVPDVIAAIEDPMERRQAEIDWDKGATVDRAWPLVGRLGAAMGLDADDLDDLFVLAEAQ